MNLEFQFRTAWGFLYYLFFLFAGLRFATFLRFGAAFFLLGAALRFLVALFLTGIDFTSLPPYLICKKNYK